MYGALINLFTQSQDRDYFSNSIFFYFGIKPRRGKCLVLPHASYGPAYTSPLPFLHILHMPLSISLLRRFNLVPRGRFPFLQLSTGRLPVKYSSQSDFDSPAF